MCANSEVAAHDVHKPNNDFNPLQTVSILYFFCINMNEQQIMSVIIFRYFLIEGWTFKFSSGNLFLKALQDLVNFTCYIHRLPYNPQRGQV